MKVVVVLGHRKPDACGACGEPSYKFAIVPDETRLQASEHLDSVQVFNPLWMSEATACLPNIEHTAPALITNRQVEVGAEQFGEVTDAMLKAIERIEQIAYSGERLGFGVVPNLRQLCQLFGREVKTAQRTEEHDALACCIPKRIHMGEQTADHRLAPETHFLKGIGASQEAIMCDLELLPGET